MKLDRNINPDGRGKYALVNLRKVDALPQFLVPGHSAPDAVNLYPVLAALALLKKAGVLTYGNETPGDQFFVMKYKDRFTAAGIGAYAVAAAKAGMTEYADELFQEEKSAAEIGTRLPD